MFYSANLDGIVKGRITGANCHQLEAIDYDPVKDEYHIFDAVGGWCTSFDAWKDLDQNRKFELIGSDQNFYVDLGRVHQKRDF